MPVKGYRPTSTSSTTDASAAQRRLLEVGRIVKPHGLSGEVVVDLLTNQTSRLDEGSELFTPDRRLRVVGARAHRGRYLVRLEGVENRTAAEELRGTRLYAEPLDIPGTLWVHELVGAVVWSVDGRRLGPVEAVEAHPAGDLLVLEGGAMIPLRFVTAHRPNVDIIVDIPEGLVD